MASRAPVVCTCLPRCLEWLVCQLSGTNLHPVPPSTASTLLDHLPPNCDDFPSFPSTSQHSVPPRDMFSNLGLFAQHSCPDVDCTRPSCVFNHLEHGTARVAQSTQQPQTKLTRPQKPTTSSSLKAGGASSSKRPAEEPLEKPAQRKPPQVAPSPIPSSLSRPVRLSS